jgi:FAD/FMN-containing dehydrogenase
LYVWHTMTHRQMLETFATELPDCGLTFDVEERYWSDWLMRAGPEDAPLALVRPKTTEHVSRILALCNEHRIPVVPQGGLTGLTGAATPSRGAVLISMERMGTVLEADPISHTIVAEAGAPLQRIQEAAEAEGLFFPLDIGSRGSCQIGGNLSTNAGGNRVLRYGMARDLVLGIEAVLADGTIIHAMNAMMKNNAGYDLKHIFIGSEGTLGIITRVVLKLFAKPKSVAVALAAFEDYAALERFLSLTRSRLGGTLTAFEAMWNPFYVKACAIRGGTPPLPIGHGAYALIEASSSDDNAEGLLGGVLETAIVDCLVADGVLAQSLAQAQAIWAVRDSSGEVALAYEPVGNFDVSVPTRQISTFVDDCTARLLDRWPQLDVNWFGHVVDGNLHLMAGGFEESDLHALEEVVYSVVREHNGSISAEHGIGLQKRAHLSYSRNAAEIAMMRQLKAAFDPNGILNPGKVFLP